MWRFRPTDWGVPHWPPGEGRPVALAEYCAARARWREARDRWLADRDVIAWPISGMTYEEYRRTIREAPHRVLHRPSATPGP
ncbi:hypothetical protein [Streptomyces sp. SAJ15]|uniref:hypothetical protein n=1 Tax=Streptomyces sp. SAJ15 TaxID=2011095 RepID=UPI001185385F|nr:hypothetical protein [Streptomyces sp. SAJ15]